LRSGFLSRLGGERERETELELFRRRRRGGLRETDGESLRLRLRGGVERERLSAEEGDLRRLPRRLGEGERRLRTGERERERLLRLLSPPFLSFLLSTSLSREADLSSLFLRAFLGGEREREPEELRRLRRGGGEGERVRDRP